MSRRHKPAPPPRPSQVTSASLGRPPRNPRVQGGGRGHLIGELVGVVVSWSTLAWPVLCPRLRKRGDPRGRADHRRWLVSRVHHSRRGVPSRQSPSRAVAGEGSGGVLPKPPLRGPRVTHPAAAGYEGKTIGTCPLSCHILGIIWWNGRTLPHRRHQQERRPWEGSQAQVRLPGHPGTADWVCFHFDAQQHSLRERGAAEAVLHSNNVEGLNAGGTGGKPE